MAYYNRNYQKLKLNRMEYLNSGDCAKVSYNHDMVLKEYFEETFQKYRLSSVMFDILKHIDNPHFIKIYDIYSDLNLLELLKYRMKILSFVVDAYTAKFYVDDSINVLMEHKDYILDNFRELDILFEIFTNNGIFAHDIKRKNAILNKNGIIIIDPDAFYQYTKEIGKSIVAKENKTKLVNLFRSICIDSARNLPDFGILETWIDTVLADIDVTENTDVTYEISKKLKYAKRPIENFNNAI